MTEQLYQFTREIPPVQASKPYTCSCLEHNLASLTRIQLCDIYYDGKFNIVALQLKTTQQLNIETPNLLVILKSLKGKFTYVTKKEQKHISSFNLCGLVQITWLYVQSERAATEISIFAPEKVNEIICGTQSIRNNYIWKIKQTIEHVFAANKMMCYWLLSNPVQKQQQSQCMLFLLRVIVDVYLNRCVSLGIRLTEWSKLIKNSEHTHIKPTTAQLGFTWPDETEHHPLSNTWVRSWILGISTLVKSQVEWLGSCSTTSRFTSVLHLNAHS